MRAKFKLVGQSSAPTLSSSSSSSSNISHGRRHHRQWANGDGNGDANDDNNNSFRTKNVFDLVDDDGDGGGARAVIDTSASSDNHNNSNHIVRPDGQRRNNHNSNNDKPDAAEPVPTGNHGADPLDLFMANIHAQVADTAATTAANGGGGRKHNDYNDDYDDYDDYNNDGQHFNQQPPTLEETLTKAMVSASSALNRRKELALVDHSRINYMPFRKDFYVEPPELASLSAKQVDLIRAELDNIKVRGAGAGRGGKKSSSSASSTGKTTTAAQMATTIPKPVLKWSQCGLPLQCYNIITSVLKFPQPTPIQAQAMPIIMSGRDVIGVAKTGSGKTMAFLLPMFRHIKDQPPLASTDGPIGIIMTPTRELAMQTYAECRRFTKALGLRTVCVYGGAPIKDHIAELKRGAEIVVCTPGRLIDLLLANSGRVTNLRRCTYLVLDEADRMFDMGFEQQVMRIIANVRPDAQRVLFSATFPRQMEALARKALHSKPIEIIVGARSVVCTDVEQRVEVMDDEAKFVRLLAILGSWYDDQANQRCLVFVDRQESADNLLRELYRRGYRCLSLHGGKDQMDRDSTISDFKSGLFQILIATSVAARGLDVKELNVVINYDCPNHMEDYVHRVGRTGRAGRKGMAYTFITPDQERYAPDIYQALVMSKATVPDELRRMKDEFLAKVGRGEAMMPGSGFGGKGLERIEKERELIKWTQKKTYGAGDDSDNDDDQMPTASSTIDEEDSSKSGPKAMVVDGTGSSPAAAAVPSSTTGNTTTTTAAAVNNAAATTVADTTVSDVPILTEQPTAATINVTVAQLSAITRARAITKRLGAAAKTINPDDDVDAILEQVNAHLRLDTTHRNQQPQSADDTMTGGYTTTLEINDFPKRARARLGSKDVINMITEMYRVSMTMRGEWVPPGRHPKPGEKKLHCVLDGPNKFAVDMAQRDIRRILAEATDEAISLDPRLKGAS